jgi:hypothetical protein
MISALAWVGPCKCHSTRTDTESCRDSLVCNVATELDSPNGNGRTSRITSYVVLSIRAGYVLPGTPTIPDQIVDNRTPYFDALDGADIAYGDGGRIDVSKMEELIGGLLAKQLTTFYAAAGGKLPSEAAD